MIPNYNPFIRHKSSFDTSLRPLAATRRPGPHETSANPSEGATAPAVDRRWRGSLWWGLAVAVCVSLAAAGVSRTPARTGAVVRVASAPGTKKAPNGAFRRWHEREVLVSIDASLDSLGGAAVSAVQAAFAEWSRSGAEVPAFRFARTQGAVIGSAPDGLNSVSMGRIDVAGHEDDVAFTVSFADTSTGEIVEEDILLNAKYAFAVLSADAGGGAADDGKSSEAKRSEGEDTNDDGKGSEDRTEGADDSPAKGTEAQERSVAKGCGQKYDLQDVMTHEAGHFLGLGEDMTESSATMYYRIDQCEIGKRSLGSGDIEMIVQVYAGASSEQRAQMQCGTSRAGGAPLWTAAGFAGLLAALSQLVRRGSSAQRSWARAGLRSSARLSMRRRRSS